MKKESFSVIWPNYWMLYSAYIRIDETFTRRFGSVNSRQIAKILRTQVAMEYMVTSRMVHKAIRYNYMAQRPDITFDRRTKRWTKPTII